MLERPPGAGGFWFDNDLDIGGFDPLALISVPHDLAEMTGEEKDLLDPVSSHILEEII